MPTETTAGGNPFQPHRYEINYRYAGQTEWARYIIVNPAITSVIVQSPEFEDVDWRVRAYDENCVPGPWTDVQTIIMQQTDSPPQLQATGIQVENKLPDPAEGCGENCTVIED